MDKTAIVFSGQGAQASGMGKFLYDNYNLSKKVFLKAENLRKGTISQCFEGSKEELSCTLNTQPCLFTVDLAAAYALEEIGIKACGCAGFSLGELAGLIYSGMLSFKEGFNLVCKRAEIMDSETANSEGAMAAILKTDNSLIEKLCAETGSVFPVNYNCKGQTVIAGTKEKIAEVSKKITEAGGRAIRLAVSGAFHSPYMENAYKKFKQVTDNITFNIPLMPLYSNVTALPYTKDVSTLLSLQIKSPVLWQKTIENMIKEGFNTFIEAGTGTTLANLIKRINPLVKVYNTNNKQEVDAVLSAL